MEQDAKVAMARQQALIRANAEAMSKAERSRLESQYKAKTASDQLCRGGVLCGADQGSPASQSSFAPADLSWGVYGYPAVYKRLAES